MPVESAADRAALFNPDEFGEAAIYTPPAGGSGTACTIVFNRGREQAFEVMAGNDTALREAIAWHGAMILVDEVPLVEESGTITVDGSVYLIVGRPNLDETGGIWTVDLQAS